MNHNFIPFHRPSIGDEEINEVSDTMRSGWLTTGPRTARFEREFSIYVGARHAVAVNSATAALHLALASLKIGPGDEVITTPMTFCATVQAILHVGATPVLADIGSDGNIDPEEIEKRKLKATARDKGDNNADYVNERQEKAAQKEERERLSKVVFLKKGGKAQLVKVTTGISDDTYMEIKSGIQPGDEVISGSYSAISRKLKDGAKVTYDKEGMK